MKINDIAVKYGVSKQAIYQRLKAGKVKLDTIRNKETQELYPEGEALLLSWYDSSVNQDNADQCLTVDQLIKLKDQALKELEEARKQIQGLEAQVAELKSQIKTAEDKAQALQQASEILTAKLEIVPELRKQIEALERDKAFLQSQIPPRITDGTEHKGFFWRLFGRGSK